MSKVVKFGGSSLASAEQFKKVGNIIRADKERKYVVPSAPGKRFSDDTKVTDMLYACYDLADQGKSFKAELDAIEARYQEIIDGLQLDLDLVDEFKTIEKNFKAKAGSNYAASRGEYLNGIIMAIIWAMISLMRQPSSSSMRTANLTQQRPMKYCVPDWQRARKQLYPASTVPCPTER